MAASFSSCRRSVALLLRHVRSSNAGLCHQHTVAAGAKASDVSEKIIIPRKKKRDSLSILKALASTVERDPNAPHYMYIDDPYLIPHSSLSKKTFALSKASGKKAARYIVDTYPDLFLHEISDPVVEAFLPTPPEYRHRDASEAALAERIEKRRVRDAVEIYKALKQSGGKLSAEVHLQLLDLVCIYNGEDPPASQSLLPEENYFHSDIGFDNNVPFKKRWHENGAAERIFEELADKPPRAYNSLIKGMCKYLQTEKAFDLYREMMEKRLSVEQDTYNHLLRVVSFHDDTYDSKWERVMGLLSSMENGGVAPGLATFNAVLFTLSRMGNFRRARSLALHTVSEMKHCGLEPSLATWRHIINIFYRSDNADAKIMIKILQELEGKEFTVRDPEDVEFFFMAMAKISNALHDVDLAYKLDAIVSRGGNRALLGEGKHESLYYFFFFRVLCTFESMEKIMEQYERMVPHMWTPSAAGMIALLEAIKLHDGFQHLPQIWSDMVLFDYIRREDLLSPVLELMASKKQEAQLQDQLAAIAEYTVNRWTSEFSSRLRRPLQLTADNMGNLLLILLHAERFDQAWSWFQKYQEHNKQFAGLPSEAAMHALVDACVQQQDAQKAVSCVRFMSEMALAGVPAAVDTVKTLDLSDSDRQYLDAARQS